jgi:hypothetical protein
MASFQEKEKIIERNNLINKVVQAKNVMHDSFKKRRFAEEDYNNILRTNNARLYGRNADEENKIDETLNQFYDTKDPDMRRRLLNSLPPSLALQLRNEEVKQNIDRKKSEATMLVYDVDNVLVNDKYDFSRLIRLTENDKQDDKEYNHALNIIRNRYNNFANLLNDYQQAPNNDDHIMTDKSGRKYYDPFENEIIESSTIRGVANSAFNKYLSFDNMKKYILEPLKAVSQYEFTFREEYDAINSPLQKLIFDNDDEEHPLGDFLYSYVRKQNILTPSEKREFMTYIKDLEDKSYEIAKPSDLLRGDVPPTYPPSRDEEDFEENERARRMEAIDRLKEARRLSREGSSESSRQPSPERFEQNVELQQELDQRDQAFQDYINARYTGDLSKVLKKINEYTGQKFVSKTWDDLVDQLEKYTGKQYGIEYRVKPELYRKKDLLKHIYNETMKRKRNPQQGQGMKITTDIKELKDRYNLLQSSKLAGNTSKKITNELKEILEILHKSGSINQNEFSNKLMSMR